MDGIVAKPIALQVLAAKITRVLGREAPLVIV
jgi:hypothetical protein